MRRLFFTSLVVIAAACGPVEVVDVDAIDTELPTPGDSDSDAPADTDETDPPVLSEYPGGRYIVTHLNILGPNLGLDLDGDSTPDNNLPNLLVAADVALDGGGFYRPTAVNERIDLLIEAEATIVLLDVTHVDGVLEIAILRAARDTEGNLVVLAENYDETGEPIQKFVGAFRNEIRFEAGPGQITLPFQFDEDTAPLEITAVDARIGGDLDVFTFDGALAGAFPTEIVLEQVVRPLVVDNLPPAEVDDTMDLIETVILAASDLQYGGEPALSGAFSVRAEAVTW